MCVVGFSNPFQQLSILFVFIIVVEAYESPSVFTIPFLGWQSVPENGIFTSTQQFVSVQALVAIELAVEDINNNPNILPNTRLEVEYVFHLGSPSVAICAIIDYSDNDQTFVVGNPLSDIAVLTGIVGNVYGVAQLSATATSSRLSDKRTYPYFSRITSPSTSQSFAVKDTLLYFEEIRGLGWTDIAILSTTDEYGVNLSTNLIDIAGDEITILTYQQFLLDTTNLDVELNEIKKSGARVIVAFLFDGFDIVINEAERTGLVGEHYVWIVPDSIVGIPFTTNSSSVTAQSARGVLGTFIFIPISSNVTTEFIARWSTLDPVLYPGAGPDFGPTPFSFLVYDMAIAAAMTVDKADQLELLDGRRVDPNIWTDLIRDVSFTGTSGSVEIDERGDRISSFVILHYVPELNSFEPNGVWSPKTGYEPTDDVIWFSNTTEIPDLDIRPEFNYWSCHSKEKRTDKTGKTISLHTPDSRDVDDIDSHYHCDRFIDCENLSDESVNCKENYTILFIVFGLITGVLLLITLLLLVFVFIFGILLKYRKLRVASPIFLIVMLISMFFGYSSVFAWFGKPHPVACAFQPWLLGLSSISMITALCVKSFRIWRIFRDMRRHRISDLQLFGLWSAIMAPAVLIVTVWTIVSTPTASIEEHDGEEHYVCTTGGFTGAPGGYVFFAILIAYGACVLLFGIFLSIVTRKLPYMFNESKLIAVSIYNILFICVCILPVFLVVQNFNPFTAWILRTLAILYTFAATMALQFTVPVFRIIVMDKGRNNTKFKSSISGMEDTSQHTHTSTRS